MTTIVPVETVIAASALEVGDLLVLPGYDEPLRVNQIDDLCMAHRATKRVIATSLYPDYVWPALHIVTSVRGIVRFPHEPVTVLRTPDANDGSTDAAR